MASLPNEKYNFIMSPSLGHHIIDLAPLSELLRNGSGNMSKSKIFSPANKSTMNKQTNNKSLSVNYLLNNGQHHYDNLSKHHQDNKNSKYNHNNIYSNANSCLVQDEDIVPEEEFTRLTSSGSSLSLNKPFCKICHMGAGPSRSPSVENIKQQDGKSKTNKLDDDDLHLTEDDKLISPCKCSGTMQYIHCACLLKWLEISNRNNEKPISCELCGHEYTWHKKFNSFKDLKLPKCSWKDIVYHTIFVATIFAMLFSAVAPILFSGNVKKVVTPSATDLTTISPLTLQLQSSSTNTIANQRANINNNLNGDNRLQYNHLSHHHHHPYGNIATNHLVNGRLAQDEKLMLICAATFFISFFLAVYVQTKARNTLYGLCYKFIAANQTYYITEYDHGQLQARRQERNSHKDNNARSNKSNSGNQNNQYRHRHYDNTNINTSNNIDTTYTRIEGDLMNTRSGTSDIERLGAPDMISSISIKRQQLCNPFEGRRCENFVDSMSHLSNNARANSIMYHEDDVSQIQLNPSIDNFRFSAGNRLPISSDPPTNGGMGAPTIPMSPDQSVQCSAGLQLDGADVMTSSDTFNQSGNDLINHNHQLGNASAHQSHAELVLERQIDNS